VATLSPFEVQQLIVQCAYDAIDHTGDLAINRKGVVPGDVAWDDCACGQLVITEERRFPSRAFPLEEIDHEANCGEPWLVIVFTLSLTRCVPMMDDNGNPPTIAALEVAAAQQSRDMSLIRPAVFCCLDEIYDQDKIMAYQLGAQEVTGPSGGCGGSDMTIMIGYTNDCGCN